MIPTSPVDAKTQNAMRFDAIQTPSSQSNSTWPHFSSLTPVRRNANQVACHIIKKSFRNCISKQIASRNISLNSKIWCQADLKINMKLPRTEYSIKSKLYELPTISEELQGDSHYVTCEAQKSRPHSLSFAVSKTSSEPELCAERKWRAFDHQNIFVHTYASHLVVGANK